MRVVGAWPRMTVDAEERPARITRGRKGGGDEGRVNTEYRHQVLQHVVLPLVASLAMLEAGTRLILHAQHSTRLPL